MSSLNSLSLGDLAFDPRRAVFVRSLRALVVSDLSEALCVGISDGLRSVVEGVDQMIVEHRPECLILLGNVLDSSRIDHLFKRWGSLLKLNFVSAGLSSEVNRAIDRHHGEHHSELIWGKYRFIDQGQNSLFDPQFLTLTSAGSISEFCIKVGGPLSGIKLSLFLKGFGRLILPSIHPGALALSPFGKNYEHLVRYDTFAVGHHRILPLGKVCDLESIDELNVPRDLLVKKTLEMVRRATKNPL